MAALSVPVRSADHVWLTHQVQSFPLSTAPFFAVFSNCQLFILRGRRPASEAFAGHKKRAQADKDKIRAVLLCSVFFLQEILSLQLGISDQDDHLFNGSALENGHPLEQSQKEPRQQKRPTLGEDLTIL